MIKAAILRNEDPYDHLPWVKACESYPDQVTFTVINLTAYDWLEKIVEYGPEVCLLKPSGITSNFRTLYQERVDILVNDLKLKVYPSYNELRLYENKRFLAYWLRTHLVPHPKTWVLYDRNEAMKLISQLELPIVGKINIGASGNGVRILKTRECLNNYVETAFSKGLVSNTGPKLGKGKIFYRLLCMLTNPSVLINRVKTYKAISEDRQIGFIILQKYIPHDFEWRVVRIGNSFFAHKKIKIGEKASGTLIKEYDNPPLSLLDFVKKITDNFAFYSVAVDVFETSDSYLVNEIQCIFGQSDDYQMKVDGKQGRYIYANSHWFFEEGDFAINACYNLRVRHILGSLGKSI